MCDLNKSPADIFKENLAAITGNNALVKLDLGNDLVIEERFKLAESRDRSLEVFTSALMVYFYHILDSKEFAKDHQDKIRITADVADILATGWVLYDISQALDIGNPGYKTVEDILPWLDIKLPEVFSFELDYPTGESLKYIVEDFERVSNVFDALSRKN